MELNIKGLFAHDSTGWQRDFKKGVETNGCGIMWKNHLSDLDEIKPQLRKLIEVYGHFPFYNLAKNKVNYKFNIIDFATEEDYEGKKDKWGIRKPFRYEDSFSDYKAGTQIAKIAFLVDKVEETKAPIHHNDFVNYNKNAGRRNAAAFKYIKTEISKEMNDYIEILEKKKNIILQGAPGVGKTYTTAELALAICDGIEKVPDNHDEVMKRYEQLQKEGRIGFVTFHQSMDYEDFVEGIKPQIIDEDKMIYKVENGIFKQICLNAGKIKTDKNSSEVDFTKTRVFKMSLGEKGKDDSEIFDYCFENNVVALGWGDDKDFSQCTKLEDFKEKDSTWGAKAMMIFKQWMRIGDIVLISDGLKAIKAIAKIVGEYEYRQDTSIGMCQIRKVEWLYTGDLIPIAKLYDKNLSQQSIYGFFNTKKQGTKEYNGSIKVDVLNNIITGKINDDTVPNYVLIIDEINRGNVSKIFGELITLLEADKRIDGDHPIKVTLPYSKEKFGVPSNLYIIGTMNTTDRSVGNIDYAVRRRFAFVTLKADVDVLIKKYGKDSIQVKLFNAVNEFVDTNNANELDLADLKVGHSFFMVEEKQLRLNLDYEIIPLLREYYKDGLLKQDITPAIAGTWRAAFIPNKSDVTQSTSPDPTPAASTQTT